MKKFFLLSLILVITHFKVFSSDDNKYKFYYLTHFRECFEKKIDQEIETVEKYKEFVTDSSDIYMYYYLIGLQTGLSQSKQIFISCDL